MLRISAFLFACALAASGAPQPPNPATVAVLYNTAQPESKALAESYAQARGVPADHLVGLALPITEEISRADFDKTLREPLVREYDRRQWWKRVKDPNGTLMPQQMSIRFLVCMRGVPLKIARFTPPDAPAPKPGESPLTQANEASVDSELALFGVEGLKLEGPANNPYYKSDKAFLQAALPMTLVGRIDGSTWDVCKRMITDAIETEKTGLWGMAAIDLSKKYPMGDEWLEDIVKANLEAGIPTLVDRFTDTLPTNYPLRDMAIYYGWYDTSVSGPFLNAGFKFRKGAVAVHLHSFSATQLRDANLNWSAPLLARGAAATLGNVYEPYLEATHHFDLFHRRLLEGYTLVEAAYMSVPVISWQNVVLGDPLYRPFLHLDGSGDKADDDRDYRALRLASLRWGKEPKKMEEMLAEAGKRMNSGVLYEAIGLALSEQGFADLAAIRFKEAKALYPAGPDHVRMDLYLAAAARTNGRTAEAIRLLRTAREAYSSYPECAAVVAWLNILDPSPPPPAQGAPPPKK